MIESTVRDDKNDGKNTQVYEKNMTKTTLNVKRNVVTREFLKKFISYVKSQKAPEIDGDLSSYAA